MITVQAVSFAQDNRKLAFPSGIEVVEEEAFAGLSEINEIELPWGIREIRNRAFTGTSAGWVYLPSSLEYIADDAFDRKVFFGYEEDSYAHEWVLAHTYFEITGNYVPPRFILFDNNDNFGNNMLSLWMQYILQLQFHTSMSNANLFSSL